MRIPERDLARVRPAMDVLAVDRSRFFPFFKEFLARHDAAAAARVQRGRRLVASRGGESESNGVTT